MPEIAEVETFNRQLEPLLVGKSILSCETHHLRSTRRHVSAEEFISLVKGKEIATLKRHGKYLAIVFVDGSYLNIHLRMSGRLIVSSANEYDPEENPKHSHIIFRTSSDVFVFIDPRTFGEMWVTTGPPMEHGKGIDALLSNTEQLLGRFLECKQSKRTIKGLLLDQSVITGIGNIYADEICFEAKVNPSRKVCELSEKEIHSLASAIKTIIPRACDLRGSSLKDESFRDLYGEIGSYQKEHKVHARAGEKCECGSTIQRIKVAGRSTYYCPDCQ